MLDHLRLTVADVAAAYCLYDPVLRCLGFEEVEREDDGVAWGRPGADQWVILTPASRDAPHDPAAPGLHHIAFAAADRATVDRAHELAAAAGAEIPAPPQEFDYEPNYYATFVRDPNGFKLEVVTRIQPGPATP